MCRRVHFDVRARAVETPPLPPLPIGYSYIIVFNRFTEYLEQDGKCLETYDGPSSHNILHCIIINYTIGGSR